MKEQLWLLQLCSAINNIDKRYFLWIEIILQNKMYGKRDSHCAYKRSCLVTMLKVHFIVLALYIIYFCLQKYQVKHVWISLVILNMRNIFFSDNLKYNRNHIGYTLFVFSRSTKQIVFLPPLLILKDKAVKLHR